MKSQINILFLLFISLVACNKEESVEPDPSMTSTTDMICNFQFPMKGDEPGENQSCVFWEYDGDSTLLMTHYNAGFNCCPEAILTSMEIRGDTLYITERDSMQLCRCNCLFDIDFVVHNLKSQKYVVKFIEPFVIEPNQPLIFNIDLENNLSGRDCDFRDYYPWKN